LLEHQLPKLDRLAMQGESFLYLGCRDTGKTGQDVKSCNKTPNRGWVIGSNRKVSVSMLLAGCMAAVLLTCLPL